MKTNKQDITERKKLFNMLQNMGSSLSIVLDNEDTLELIQSNNTDAYQVYNNFIVMIDKEISKLILGATLINSEGASFAQANVHQSQFDSLIERDKMVVNHIVNDELFPRLAKLGFIPENLKFVLKEKQVDNTQKDFENDLKLMQYFELNIDYLNKKYNTAIISAKNNSPLI